MISPKSRKVIKKRTPKKAKGVAYSSPIFALTNADDHKNTKIKGRRRVSINRLYMARDVLSLIIRADHIAKLADIINNNVRA